VHHKFLKAASLVIQGTIRRTLTIDFGVMLGDRALAMGFAFARPRKLQTLADVMHPPSNGDGHGLCATYLT